MMKYFFWIAFAVFLAASIPHVAYFFASFEPSQGPEGVWWWAVSYAIAISIDVTVYLLSYTAFKRYRQYRSAKAVWQHWVLIVMCTVFSWAVNWAYAKQFHSPVMLSSAESAAPWLTSVFPFMASAFPLLGIVYTMMAETVAETVAEEQDNKNPQMQALSALAKQTQLPITSLRRALASGARLNPAALVTTITNRTTSDLSNEPKVDESKAENNRAITGQFVAVDGDSIEISKGKSNPALMAISTDGSPDKLQMTIEALRANPELTDEALAEKLSLKRPASARFWRLKAIEILNTTDKEASEAVLPIRNPWTTSNGASVKR